MCFWRQLVPAAPWEVQGRHHDGVSGASVCVCESMSVCISNSSIMISVFLPASLDRRDHLCFLYSNRGERCPRVDTPVWYTIICLYATLWILSLSSVCSDLSFHWFVTFSLSSGFCRLGSYQGGMVMVSMVTGSHWVWCNCPAPSWN